MPPYPSIPQTEAKESKLQSPNTETVVLCKCTLNLFLNLNNALQPSIIFTFNFLLYQANLNHESGNMHVHYEQVAEDDRHTMKHWCVLLAAMTGVSGIHFANI
jgi:hypothetical protein